MSWTQYSQHVTVEERFYANIKHSGKHWLWTGARTGNGYPALQVAGKSVAMHRWSYEHFKGPIPPGAMVCHHCDIKHCVNPECLYAGNGTTNAADREGRGRSRRPVGSRHPNAKLTEAAVRTMRQMANRGMTQRDIAAQFGVTQRVAGAAINGEAWKHVR